MAAKIDPVCLAEWFLGLRESVLRFLQSRRTVPRGDVDDLAQEVFVRLLRYGDPDLIKDPQRYVFKIAARVASNWSAHVYSRLAKETYSVDDIPDPSNPVSTLESLEQEHDLEAALTSLPARAREILRLHYDEALTYEQISATMGVTRRVVKRDLASAYVQLRDLMTDSAHVASPAESREAMDASGGRRARGPIE
jgi:RNA polymerase sigma-70 factor (ECF subfamily)